MDPKQLVDIGDTLRSLGHERREVVEEIIGDGGKDHQALGQLYQRLDNVSERCINLMERQRSLVGEYLADEQA